MAIEVKTTEFEFSHGRKPRGNGHWAFTFQPGLKDDYFWAQGNYGEAKKAAIKEAKRRGAHTVVVGS